MATYMRTHEAEKALMLFHNIGRQLYARLVGHLGFDIHLSMKILAFWSWLESCGHSNVVYKLLQLPDSVLFILTKQAINLLYYLIIGVELNPYVSMEYQIRYISRLLGSDFSHWFVYGNRHIAMLEIGEFVENECVRVFEDIVMHNPVLAYESQLIDALWVKIVGPILSVGAAEILSDSYYYFSSSFSTKLSLSTKERTLYVKFSRAHPVSMEELLDYFIGTYGVIVEHMYVEKQNLFARIVLANREDVTKVFKGERTIQLSVYGKRGLAWRFVTMQEAIETHHKWPQPNISSTTAINENIFNICFDLSNIFQAKQHRHYTLF